MARRSWSDRRRPFDALTRSALRARSYPDHETREPARGRRRRRALFVRAGDAAPDRSSDQGSTSPARIPNRTPYPASNANEECHCRQQRKHQHETPHPINCRVVVRRKMTLPIGPECRVRSAPHRMKQVRIVETRVRKRREWDIYIVAQRAFTWRHAEHQMVGFQITRIEITVFHETSNVEPAAHASGYDTDKQSTCQCTFPISLAQAAKDPRRTNRRDDQAAGEFC